MTTVIVPISKFINKKINKDWSIGTLAQKCQLNFTHYELFGTKLIGLDAASNKLLFLKKMNNRICYCIIHLKQVESCVLKTIYAGIEAGGLLTKSLNYYLTSISLQVKLIHAGKTMILPFYERAVQPGCPTSLMEAKAKKWMELINSLKPDYKKDKVGLQPYLINKFALLNNQ